MSSSLQIEVNIIIQARPERVMQAFFDPDELAQWWGAVRSVTVPRPLGSYAIEWGTTDFRDDVLGRLGGAFHGVVIDYRAGEEFFIADAYWTPPDGEPIGPMALIVTTTPHGGPHITNLVVRQSGEDDGIRWQRYFEMLSGGWQRALGDLKQRLDAEGLQNK
jgi:uncharacterized protein YndB with AHSA1/START domain